MAGLAGGAALLVGVQADSVVVFNEIMYHPATPETRFEWIELHNQMAVRVDLSGWTLAGGVAFEFPEGTVLDGGGYLVIAISPVDLSAVTGLAPVLGPFSGRLANGGESLRLLNRNRRVMDAVAYGADGEWPVAPDGSGVSLAKRHPDAASAVAANWAASTWVGGTPGQLNFSEVPFTVNSHTLLNAGDAWRFRAVDGDAEPGWAGLDFDDASWASGSGLFREGEVPPPTGDPELVPGAASTGRSDDGTLLPPGSADPHYALTESAQSTPPPPAQPATVIQHHPAWLANDLGSSWIGPVNPGTADVAAGAYRYRTAFSLAGFDPASADLRLRVAADNRLLDVLWNGTSRGFAFEGFTTLSEIFTINAGFQAGTNTLDFLTVNDGTTPNPAGFRAQLTVTARRALPIRTDLPPGHRTYFLRTQLVLDGAPTQVGLRLGSVVADGAVFYLNGAEVWRVNLPAGPITLTTPALSNVLQPVWQGPLEVNPGVWLPGTNVLAVELHRGPAPETGVLFGATCTAAVTNVLVPPPIALAFNEVVANTNTGSWFELMNTGATDLDLADFRLVRAGALPDAEALLPATVLGPGQIHVLPTASLGFGAVPGDRLFLYTRAKDRVVDAVVVGESPRGRSPDGTGPWAFPSAVTPGQPNVVVRHEQVVLNELMYHAPDLPPRDGGVGTNALLSVTNAWKYHALGQDLGSAWRQPGFDDGAWPEGQGLFYHTTSVLPAPKHTLLSLTNSAGERIITWYFRAPFTFEGGTNAADLRLYPLVDDGAVVYLNGVEIYRQNLPAGPIEYRTLTPFGVATPAFTGPWTVPVTNLVPGTNWLAVEVHQFTTNPIAADMAFGLDVTVVGQLIPASPGGPSAEAWVELHNRGADAVDMTGWRLAGAVNFVCPSGTVLAPGGFLVVAADAAGVRSNAPWATVVGPFAGRLGRAGGRVQLIDATGNLADEVAYADDRPWPAAADGGGSSLELRDPWADNARPEAWAASVASAQAEWRDYAYRGTANNRGGPTLWNEFVLGLLDAGECLLDDLSVIEDPDGAAVSLLPNGGFETGLNAWRALGNHRHSGVVPDPERPGNHVLHLIATGPTEHLHNHLETTLTGGRAVTDGRVYAVRFRAKWLSGNPRLNTRLYFNRVARTTRLAPPEVHGTPGAANSTRVDNFGPTFRTPLQGPVVPAPGEPVTASVEVTDAHGVDRVTLHWAVDGGPWNAIAMTGSGAADAAGYVRYGATVPGQSAGALVHWYVDAVDVRGARAYFPTRGPESRALWRVSRGEPLMPQLHRLRLLMTSADAQWLHASTNVMSMDRIGATLVYDEREVFPDVGVHLQGSERGRDASSRVGFTVRLNADQLFRGVQNTITIDRSGGYSGRGGRHDEILLWHAVNHAGGIPGLECDLVQVFAPRSQEDGTGLLRLSAFDGEYFDDQFDDGGDGDLYTLELIYYPTTTTTGDPQAPKLPQPDDVIGFDLQDQGDDPEAYRWQFLQENHAAADDYGPVLAFCRALSLSGAALEAEANRRVDLDLFLRPLAFKALTGDVDTYTQGYPHNWKFYFRPGDGRAVGLLWDMDFSFVHSIDAAFPGTASATTHRFLTLPNVHRRYLNHLLDLLTRSVNAVQLQPWAAHYAGLLGEDWTGPVQYLQQRADYIRARLPLTTLFAITSNGGLDFSTTNNPVTLTGTAPMTVKDLRISGLVRPVTWTSLTTWTVRVPLTEPVNRLVVEGLDNDGRALVGAVDSITVTNQGALAPRPVIINEWMADNAGPGGYYEPAQDRYPDWFELYNPNPVAVDLSGFQLTDTLTGLDRWIIPSGTVIPAGGFLLVWADRRPDLNGPAGGGPLHADFQLSNTGEALGLFAPDGTLQHAVGFGAQPSNVSQGWFPDGMTNALRAMLQWTPGRPNSIDPVPAPTMAGVGVAPEGTLTLTVEGLPDRAYRLDRADDLADPLWMPLSTNRMGVGPLRLTEHVGDDPHRFYRVVVLP